MSPPPAPTASGSAWAGLIKKMFCYSNNGNSFRAVNATYTPAADERLLPCLATEDQLNLIFPDRIVVNLKTGKAKLLADLNIKLHEYIDPRYDQGTQSTFNGLSIKILRGDFPPEVATLLQTALDAFWNWIKTVLDHYYAVKKAIVENEPYELNFSQFDATDPNLVLGNIIGQYV